jgi:peptidoglycan hydrolase CwlO-like protein
LAVRRARNRLNRQAGELNDLKAIVNKSVRDYNKLVEKFKEDKRKMEQLCEEKFKEDKRKLEQLEGRIQVREDCLKEREKLMEDFEDNMTLAELRRTLTGI